MEKLSINSTVHSGLISTTQGLSPADQMQLSEILDHYLQEIEKGAPLSPEKLLERYPEYAPLLQQYLEGLQLFHRHAVAPSQAETLPFAWLGPERTSGDCLGEFRIMREIGRGGMGVVYEAEQRSLRRRVALKILPMTVSRDAKHIARFRNEAQAAAQIQHPHIVPVYAIGEEQGVHYYSMQLIEGESLTKILEDVQAAPVTLLAPRDKTSSTTVAPPRMTQLLDVGPQQQALSCKRTHDHVRAIARLGIQIAEALHAAHEYGIVHRDVKPSNVLVDNDGNAWITDFGLARVRDNDGLTQTGDILGTMRYMSPEQFLGRAALVDHRTDIYSLGLTLYELTTLQHPAGDRTDAQLLAERAQLQIKPLRSIDPRIPTDFQTIIMKAVAEFPGERYATSQEMADDLQRFLNGEPIQASPPSLLTRVGKWAQRHRRFVFTAALVLTCGLLGQSYYNFQLNLQNIQILEETAAKKETLGKALAVLDNNVKCVDQLETIAGAQGVRYQMLQNSVDFFEQFAKQAEAVPSLASDLAFAYGKLGSLGAKLGDHEFALGKHKAALAIWQELVANEPENGQNVCNSALCQNDIALLLASSGQFESAERLLDEAKRTLLQLATKKSGECSVNSALGLTYGNLGLILRQANRTLEASAAYEAAVEVLEEQRLAEPADESVLRALAACYDNLGSLLDSTLNDDIVAIYQKAIAIQAQLVKSQPLNRIYQADLAKTYNNLGYTHTRQRRWNEATECYQSAIDLQSNLIKNSPLELSYKSDIAITYNNLGMVQSRRQQYQKAEKSFRQSIAEQHPILEAVPNDVKSLSNLGSAYNNLGLLQEIQGKPAEAERWYRGAINAQRKAQLACPHDPHISDLLQNHYANYMKSLRSRNKLDAAQKLAVERDSILLGQLDK